MPPDALKSLIEAVTGSEIDMVRTGKRILNMRHLFNLREGLKPTHDLLPARCVGKPPLAKGPLSGNSVDHIKIAENFFKAIGWNIETMMPGEEALKDMNGKMVRHGNYVSGFSTHTVIPEDGLIPWHQISILGHNFGMTKSITDIPKYVHMAMTQDMKIDKLVTNKFKLEDINDVVEKMHARQVHGRWVWAFD